MDKLETSIYGMHLDQVFFQRKPGFLSYALNANIQSKDGRGITYTNEMSNQLCVQFPDGYQVIGSRLVLAKNEIIFALVNIATGDSEIGRVKNYNCNNLTAQNTEYNCQSCRGKILTSDVVTIDSCCKYETIINARCLEFDIDHPVRMTYKISNCGYKLYFTDDFNEPRYIDLEDPIGKDECNVPLPEFDCERIKIFKDFCSPIIEAKSIESGGSLEAGVYQATIVYTDVKGQEYTNYFEFTNPVPIFDRTLTVDTDYVTNKAIKFKITHNTDVFDYFKLVVIKTVNETSEYIEAGVYRVANVNNVTFTNNDKTLVRTSLERIRSLRPDYTKANFIEESSDHLLLADLEGDPDYNFQPFANQMRLFWETVSMPYDSNNNYSNPIVSSRFRGYMRDEVYAFGIRFKYKNGGKSKAFHIPNREGLINFDFEQIPVTNKDNVQAIGCDDPEIKPRWKVYNTGTNLGNVVPITSTDEKICDITRHQYGEFGYYESTETYPCDKRTWGDLAGTPIRFHKIPDCIITHIHDSFNLNHPESTWYDINHLSTIYPIGVRLDEGVFNSVLANTMIFDPETQDYTIPMSEIICGFEIVRGNRVGNKSIDAKGILYDVGKVTERDGSTNLRSYYFPNYPYNDLAGDRYLSADRTIYNTPDVGSPNDKKLYAYPNYAHDPDGQNYRRFTFHGPDVHFQRPTLGNILKLETEEFGLQEGHFVQVDKHPRYKFLTKFDSLLATLMGSAAAVNIKNESTTRVTVTDAGEERKGVVDFNYADFLSTSNQVRELITTLIPKRNFAYAYHSRGVYNNYLPVPNSVGQKVRSLDIAKYLSPNNQNVGDDASIHNYGRESSVYLKTNDKFKPYDRPESSRFTLGDHPDISDPDWCQHPDRIHQSKIRSWYASIKREVPDQYGNIDAIDYLTTGYSVTLQNGQFVQTYYPIFGGDTFINRFALKRKMPFFTQNMVGRPDEVDFDYDLVPNIAFPTYYIGTSPDELRLDEIVSTGDLAALLTGLLLAGAGTIVPIPGGGAASQILNLAAMLLIAGSGVNIYSKLLTGFLPKNNLDCDTTPADLSATFKTRNIAGVDVPVGIDLGVVEDYTIFYQSGKFYLASYGIPNFFVESDINTEYRHARNEKEENFYPNVGNGIPDNWLQEAEVPILHDNKYNYNATYSAQNNQEFIESFNNYNFNKLCQSDFPNRIIYSEKSNLEENFDNWLRYAQNNYHDFDKSNGKIVGIHSLDNNRLLVRFENTFQIWNTRITLPSTSPLEVSMSNSGMFTQDPVEFSKTTTGHGGSQHIAFENTKAGNFWVDAKRGTIFRFAEGLEEISQSNYNWFKENLPFKILEDFPEYNIDNNYKDVGIAMCWDERFQRLFITKKDYKLLPEKVGEVYFFENRLLRRELDLVFPVSLDDPEYFANKSFTIAWSPIIKDWVSFYSFLPNYYISHPTHFQSGIHNSLWNHGLSNLSYQTFYGDLYPYILEKSITNIPSAEYLKSISVHCDILKYTSETDFYSTKTVNSENYNIFFNKAIIYNKEQCSGVLHLVETPLNNMRERMRYPIFTTNGIDILYSKYDKVCTFNTFFDATRDHSNGQPIFTDEWASIQAEYPIDKVLNADNLSYRNNYKKQPIKSNECYVRLIQDIHSRYKFVNNFELFQQENKNQR